MLSVIIDLMDYCNAIDSALTTITLSDSHEVGGSRNSRLAPTITHCEDSR